MTETNSDKGRLQPIPRPYCSEEDPPYIESAGEQPPLRAPITRHVQTSGGWDPDDVC